MSVSYIQALDGITVLERGWLSSNNVLIHARDGEPGAVLVDSGHVTHAAQTVALVQHALAGGRLDRVVNTHLHSDHCGGNASLQRAFGAPVFIPPGQAEAVRCWDEVALSYAPTGQLCERFEVAGIVAPGDALHAGGRRFEVLGAPGHDPDSLVFFDAANGLLISADALWENGFGVVFPELEGERAFDDVAFVLDLIEALPVQVVVPGHGSPFTDVAGALARARRRLDGFVADPKKHARYAAKVLVSYHLLEMRSLSVAQLREWVQGTPLFHAVWRQAGRDESPAPPDWGQLLAEELVTAGALLRTADGYAAAS